MCGCHSRPGLLLHPSGLIKHPLFFFQQFTVQVINDLYNSLVLSFLKRTYYKVSLTVDADAVGVRAAVIPRVLKTLKYSRKESGSLSVLILSAHDSLSDVRL